MNNNNKGRFTPLLISLSIIIGILIGTFCTSHFAGNRLSIINTGSNKLSYLLQIIDNNYVDTVNMSQLVEDAMPGILKELDPHSSYLSAQDAKEADDDLRGQFSGIGVSFVVQKDTVNVMSVIHGGPAEKVGLMAGDRIVSANGKSLIGMESLEVMKHLKGQKGSKVKLGIVRHGVKGITDFTVVRGDIPVVSVDAYYMINEKTGYIRVKNFGEQTYAEMLVALAELNIEGMEGLVVDLRGNTGGYMHIAIQMANEFLPKDRLIVYTEGRAARRSEFLAHGTGQMRNGRLVVLVDEYSASASEIVTGAVQDWDRGVVIGRRTFGKGLVQRVQRPIDLPDGSMIRLTVARYYTPAGRCIQKPYDRTATLDSKALTADGTLQYNRELIDRFNHGEMIHADSIHFADSLKVKTRRLERTVYGGGGIMPDVFVPMDTARYTDYHRHIVARGVVIKATTSYIERNRKALQSRYKKFASFNDQFQIDDAFLAEVRALAERENIPFNEEQYNRSLPLIKVQLKALIARDLWGMSEYYQVVNSVDPVVGQALKVFNEGGYEAILPQ